MEGGLDVGFADGGVSSLAVRCRVQRSYAGTTHPPCGSIGHLGRAGGCEGASFSRNMVAEVDPWPSWASGLQGEDAEMQMLQIAISKMEMLKVGIFNMEMLKGQMGQMAKMEVWGGCWRC